ncbi:MAG: chromate transporter, partial [Pseudomonadota bacterium]
AAYILAIAAFVGLFLFQLPFPLIVVAAALVGMFVLPADRGTVDSTPPGKAGLSDARPSGPGPLSLALRAAAVWGAIWVLPLVGVVAVFGTDSVFADLALFFSKLAVVTFGGAYAVLSYVAQEAVSGYGWLKPGEMVDGLGLAETTPGPLILVTQFVAFLGAFRADADMPLLFGLFGMAVTLWATFAPCFLWIFVGAPFISQLERLPRLRSALAGVTAAVVGVIANLSVWFAMNVLFYELQAADVLGGQLSVPVVASLNVNAAILAVVGFVALFAVRLGVLFTLAVCALGGLLLSAFV